MERARRGGWPAPDSGEGIGPPARGCGAHPGWHLPGRISRQGAAAGSRLEAGGLRWRERDQPPYATGRGSLEEGRRGGRYGREGGQRAGLRRRSGRLRRRHREHGEAEQGRGQPAGPGGPVSESHEPRLLGRPLGRSRSGRSFHAPGRQSGRHSQPDHERLRGAG